MGKRYFCDYCDRSFVDDIEARKKHLNGSVHIRLRKEHYDKFKDGKTVLLEESAKIPCKRYQRNGECVFGSNCRYSHYTPQEMENLRLRVQEEERLEEIKRTSLPVDEGEGPSLTSWLQKRSQVKLLVKSSGETNSHFTWAVPQCLQGRSHLPPSLQSIRIEDFTSSEFESWG
ncbi:zinc finger matrin-type protein 5 [Anabrus simplex]|uniref:zinc finger matrin-type protein 5 n=1 Tax=Anabrus simplex TaxID=316456 RepID=UPI0034DD57A0